VLIQDSDLEYEPAEYPALIAPLQRGETNVVYGVRPDRPERGLRFFLGAKFLTHLTNLLYGAHIHDEATCYKVFRRSLLARIRLECRRLQVLPRGYCQALPHGRDRRGSSHLLEPTLRGTRQENSPCRRLAGNLPEGLLALDPQLVCYSWMTGISDVAQVVFVRKSFVEVQYLRTTITEEHRKEFGRVVEDTIRRIESAKFLPHGEIRFPQNPTTRGRNNMPVWGAANYASCANCEKKTDA
jgi:hypothetical protein